MPLTLKSKSGKILAKEENPTVFRLTAEDKENIKVVWSKRLQDFLNSKKGGSGYIPKSTFDAMNVSTVPIPANFAGLEAVDVPPRLEEQLFRIYAVEENEDYVTVRARHVWYDNLQNYTLWKPAEDTSYTAAAVCRNILTNAVSPVESEVASDCTDEKPGSEFDYERKNLVECFLDPENGVCAKYGLSLIRDNWDFYCLKNVGYDRGYVIQTGKNLLGVVRTESVENVATRVCPIGMDDKGGIVWLDNNGKKYVDSVYIGDYAFPRVEIYDTGLQVGQDDVTAENINGKLLEAAQARFSEDKVDLPEVTMTINFLSIGDTEEYAQYRGLDKVYLYDIVTIKDTIRGYEYTAQVVGVEHDILTGMLNSITLGKITNSDGVRKIAVWQVPEISGENIRLKSLMAGVYAPGSILTGDLAEDAVSIENINGEARRILVVDALEAAEANIHELIAGSITADDIVTGSLTADTIAAGAITTEKLDAGAVTADKIGAGEITTVKLAAAAITSDKIASNAINAGHIAADAVTASAIQAGSIISTKIASGAITTEKLDAYAVTANKLAADAVTADKISANAVTAEKISTTDITAINAKLGVADIADARIGVADINYAHVKDLDAQSAYFGQAIIQEGLANKLYIPRLAANYAQIVNATISDLVIQAQDDNFYKLDVGLNGNVTATQVNPTEQEIEDGHTADGRTIYLGTDIIAQDLNTMNIYASHALMDEITANILNVDKLFARDATIAQLNVMDLSSNTYIRSTIGDWNSGSTITQTINGINSRISSLGYGTIFMQPDEPDHSNLTVGDIWIQTISDGSWEEIYDAYSSWEDVYNNCAEWQALGGVPKMLVWDGSHFQLMYDAYLPDLLQTEINQLASEITLLATKTQLDAVTDEMTEFRAQLTVQAEQISIAVSTVNAKAASFVMWEDPTTEYDATIGDIWIKYDEDFCDSSTWGSVYNEFSSWQELYDKHETWGDSLGSKTFVWNGIEWVETTDRASEINLNTEIIETSRKIELLVEASARLGDELIQQKASISVTASMIAEEVERATMAEAGMIQKTSRYQTADSIVQEAVEQSANYGDGQNGYIKKTTAYQDAESIKTSAVSAAHDQADSAYIHRTNTLQTADSIINEAVRQAGVEADSEYIAKTTALQTADQILMQAEGYSDEHFYFNVSNIDITANGIAITGSKYLRMNSGSSIELKSGAIFSVQSGNFAIDSSGNVFMTGSVTAKAGAIASWNIEDSWLYTGTGGTCVTLVGGAKGSTSDADWNRVKDYAMYAGASWPETAPLRIKKDGTIYLTKLIALDANNNETVVNLRTVGLWKLYYETIKPGTITTDSGGYCTSFELSNGTPVNFKSAASVTLSGGWSGNTFKVTNSGNDRTARATISFSKSAATVKSDLSSGTHKTTLSVDDTDYQASPLTMVIDGTGAYDAGFAEGEAQFTLFPRNGYEVTNWQQYGNTLYVQMGSMYVSVGSGFVQVNEIGDVYTKAEE